MLCDFNSQHMWSTADVRTVSPPAVQMMAWSPLLIAALVATLLYRWCSSTVTSVKRLPLPPGPQGTPLLGMTVQVVTPSKKHASLFEDWEKQSGGNGIMMFPTLFRKQVIISDAKLAYEVLEKRGTKYAERAPNYYADTLQASGLNLVAIASGPRIESIRKMFHEVMSPAAVARYQNLQASNAYATAMRLLSSKAEDISHVIDDMQKQLTLRMFCGNLDRDTYDKVKAAEHAMDLQPMPAIAPLLDLFPSLQWLPEWAPGGSYKKTSKSYLATARSMYDVLRTRISGQLSSDDHNRCIWEQLYDSAALQRYGLSEDDCALVVGNQLGSNFVPSIVLRVFILAMLHYPEVLRKAQNEIDRVVGGHRLPTMADEQDLHYIRALQAEIIRWRPVVPLVQPHLASQDDEVDGYRIPSQALVWANLQAMSRNADIYPSPDRLMPERFLTAGGQFTRKDELSVFGYGRRRCPGAYLAAPILFINIATLVWAMDIYPGAEGLPSIDTEDWDTYITFIYPRPFSAQLVPRDTDRAALLEHEGLSWL